MAMHFPTIGTNSQIFAAKGALIRTETGSHLTAHTTIQSFRTGETVVDRKEAVSAGILPPILNVPGSLPIITVSRVDFWPPVSASKNSVPGDRISGRN